MAITIDDPREVSLPRVGWIELEDSESGTRLVVDTSSDTTRLKLQMAAEEARLVRVKTLKRTEVDHIPLWTNRPYAEPLHRAFAERARRLRR